MINLIKRILPPFLFDLIYYSPLKKYGWSGNYSTWQEARKNSGGYEASIILEKVKEATLKVKEDKATYERDSVLFEKIEYEWALLAGLLWVAAQENGQLHVVDFGGSLGSTYWQNRKFLKDLHEVKWNIIEQPQFVECGRTFIENDELKFYNDFTSCLKDNPAQVVLLSGVLQYLEKPFELLTTVTALDVNYVIIDRLPFIRRGADRLTVQKVHPDIYPASYPAWFFGKKQFMDFITSSFEVIEAYDSDLKMNIQQTEMGGLILRKKRLE